MYLIDCVMFGVHFSVLILLNMAFGNTTDMPRMYVVLYVLIFHDLSMCQQLQPPR